MTSEPPRRPDVRPRYVIDTGVFVAAALSAKGAPRRLLEAAVAGRVGLVISDHLLSELSDVLHRPKFRRWLTIEHADTFVQAVALLGEHRADPDLALRQRLCRDPKDEYLIALAEDTDATFLVSGDSDLQAVEYGPVLVRDPASALAALEYRHPWTIAAMRADSEEELWRRARAEGNDLVLNAASALVTAVAHDAVEIIPLIVTPESLPAWIRGVESAKSLLVDRGMTTRPEYATQDIAYVKIVPDSGDNLLITGDIMLPDALIMTMQRRPELPDPFGLGGWRAHSLGDPSPIDQMPGPAASH